MDPRWENFLRRSMQIAGNAVEKLIGQAKKARVSVTSSSEIEPIIAIESQLTLAKIKELVNVSLTRIVTPFVPNLVDKSALELTEGPALLSPLFKNKGAATAVHVDIGGSAGAYAPAKQDRLLHVRALLKNIPFEDGFYDFVVANLATSQQGELGQAIKEVARLTTLQGRAVIVDYHPFGRFAKRGNVRLRPLAAQVKGVEDYYKACKAAGLQVEYLKESFFDETMRGNFSQPEEKAAFRGVKDSPFLIFFMVTKRGR